MNSDGTVDFASQVFGLISELAKSNEVCNRECVACFGVTTTQAFTILSLPGVGALSMSALSKTFGVDRSTMTRMIDQLVDKTLVYRKTDEKDRRLIRIGLTAQGQELHRDLEQALRNFYEAALAEIRGEERFNILQSLERLNKALTKAIEACIGTDAPAKIGRDTP